MLIIVAVAFFVLLFIFIFFGLLHKNSLQKIIIPQHQNVFNKNCSTSKVSCNNDLDCQELCAEASAGEDMVCRTIPRYTKHQQDQYGPTGKFCVPAKAKMECNTKYGGVPVFTGWGDPERMEFDCLCSYPEYASSQHFDDQGNPISMGCQLNPGVCENGTMNWDLTKNPINPSPQLCTCDPSYTKMIDPGKGGIPRCVPTRYKNFYQDLYEVD